MDNYEVRGYKSGKIATVMQCHDLNSAISLTATLMVTTYGFSNLEIWSWTSIFDLGAPIVRYTRNGDAWDLTREP